MTYYTHAENGDLVELEHPARALDEAAERRRAGALAYQDDLDLAIIALHAFGMMTGRSGSATAHYLAEYPLRLAFSVVALANSASDAQVAAAARVVKALLAEQEVDMGDLEALQRPLVYGDSVGQALHYILRLGRALNAGQWHGAIQIAASPCGYDAVNGGGALSRGDHAASVVGRIHRMLRERTVRDVEASRALDGLLATKRVR